MKLGIFRTTLGRFGLLNLERYRTVGLDGTVYSLGSEIPQRHPGVRAAQS